MSSLRGYRPAIIANRLRYVHPDGTVLFGNLTFSATLARYGLIGPNGIGKTTLLRLIAGELQPDGGELRVVGSTGYLPQRDDAAVRESLSGGERMRARLAQLVEREPAWLLLDEPTNHLDSEGLAALYAILDRWRGGAIVASHDRELLGRVERVFELSSLGVRSYGGAYDLYVERRRLEETAAEAAIRSAQSRLDHERRDQSIALERIQRATEHGKKRAKQQDIPKVARGAMQRAAQVTAAKSAATHGDRVGRAEDRLRAARASRRDERAIVLDLPETSFPAKKRVLRCAGLNVTFDGRRLWRREVDLELMGPARIAIGGRNGSGKTSLLRILAGQPPACARIDGLVDVGVRAVYLDQHLAFLRDDLSLVNAMRDAAPQLREHERRIRLGRLLFEQERGLQPIGHLSGGERARAAFALLLYQPQPPQLLLLDEPTNNLDIPSTKHLMEVLLSFRGGIVAVSHDREFLKDIEIERELNLDEFG